MRSPSFLTAAAFSLLRLHQQGTGQPLSYKTHSLHGSIPPAPDSSVRRSRVARRASAL